MCQRLWLGALALCAIVVGVQSYAQSPKRIGVVAASVSERSEEADAFRRGLRDLGYVEGRDVSILWWYGGGTAEEAPQAVQRLLAESVDVLVVESTRAALAASRATTRVPIIMAVVGDPVEAGVVGSLARPGGNITGLTNQSPEVATKRLQLLHEVLPEATKVLVPYNPNVPYSGRYIRQLEAAAREMRVKLTLSSTQTPEQVRSVLARVSLANTDVIMPIDDAFMTSQGSLLIEGAEKARVPLIYAYTPLARRGALLSYAVDHNELFRRAAGYVDKVFKGASPGTLPVEQPTKFVLAVNLKTAKSLGIRIPSGILLQAEEVIR